MYCMPSTHIANPVETMTMCPSVLYISSIVSPMATSTFDQSGKFTANSSCIVSRGEGLLGILTALVMFRWSPEMRLNSWNANATIAATFHQSHVTMAISSANSRSNSSGTIVRLGAAASLLRRQTVGANAANEDILVEFPPSLGTHRMSLPRTKSSTGCCLRGLQQGALPAVASQCG